MAERVEHAPGISKTPGMAARRPTEREHEWLAHEGSYPTYGPVRAQARGEPHGAHAPAATILAQFAASQPSRAFWICPVRAPHAPLCGSASRMPGSRCAISTQSRLHRK